MFHLEAFISIPLEVRDPSNSFEICESRSMSVPTPKPKPERTPKPTPKPKPNSNT